MNKINLKMNNLGPINEASIDLNKITVVGGKNASGKSITSKLLFCFLFSTSNPGLLLNNNHVKDLFVNFKNKWINKKDLDENHVKYDVNSLEQELSNLLNKWDNKQYSYNFFKSFYDNYVKIIEKSDILDL